MSGLFYYNKEDFVMEKQPKRIGTKKQTENCIGNL